MNVQAQTEDWVENVTLDELTVGQSASLQRVVTFHDIEAFAAVSGDTNPAHLNAEYAEQTMFHGVIAHGMLGASFISALLGSKFPGAGTIYLGQTLKFSKPVRIGDTLTVQVTVAGKDSEKKRIKMDCVVTNQHGEAVLAGEANLLAPTQKVKLPAIDAPQIRLLDAASKYRELLRRAQGFSAVRCAVVFPCDKEKLNAAMMAARYSLIKPVLIGPEAHIRGLAQMHGIELHGAEIVSIPDRVAAAQTAVVMAAHQEVEVLMQGSLDTHEFLKVVWAEASLRGQRCLSHIFRIDAPQHSQPLWITDAAIHIAPTLQEKVNIIQNAIDFVCAAGVSLPKVAVLSAVETVTANFPSSLDAQALCKMAQSGKILGGVLDGPLAFDSAVSMRAVRSKGITSAVAGQADIVVVPNLESGSMLVKQQEYEGGACVSGLVLGANVPIVLTHQGDSAMAAGGSCALAMLAIHGLNKKQS